MAENFFHERELWAPHFMFLRCAGVYSDRELLDTFGLSAYALALPATSKGRHAIFADDGQWTMIADDFYYTLFNMESTRPALASLAQRFDAFACAMGDIDSAFDFAYFGDSKLVRKFVVVDPDFKGGTIEVDFGPPLPGEPAKITDVHRPSTLLRIAAALGIKTNYDEKDIRVYVPSAAT